MRLAEYLHKHYTQQTAKSYEREIDIYLTNNPTAKKYDYADIVHYIGVLRRNYKNARTIKRIVSSIKAYYSYLADTNQRKDNPAKAIQLRDTVSREVQLQDLFTVEELERLLTVKQERYGSLEQRNKVLMSLLVYQGLHPRELAGVKITDIDLAQATIYIPATNNTNGRILPLRANQILLFKEYLDNSRKQLLQQSSSDKLLVGIRKKAYTVGDISSHIKENYQRVFGNRRVTAKTIRQSVIANLLKQQHDLRLVQTYAGHKYTSTTQRYQQNEVELLRQQINLHHPIQ